MIRNLPLKSVAKMRYVGGVTLTTGLIPTVHHFRANSIYDPDATGTGHQPMGRDEYANFYQKYIVLGSRIRVYWSTDAGAAVTVCGVFINDDNSIPYTSYEGIIESKRGKYKSIPHQRNATSTTCSFSSKKYFNVTDIKDNYDDIGALVGANPAKQAYFTIWSQDVDFQTTHSVQAVCVIDYIVTFQEPKELNQS